MNDMILSSLSRAWRASGALTRDSSSRHGILSLIEYPEILRGSSGINTRWRQRWSCTFNPLPRKVCSSVSGDVDESRGSSSGIVNLGVERKAISVSGHNALGFLQNLVTNDTSTLSDNNKSMYCHMLNSKGRFMYDIFLNLVSKDHVLVDVAYQQKDALVKVLKMYSLRSGVRIQDVSDEYHIFACLGNAPSLEYMRENDVVVFGEDARLGSMLGFRGISTSPLVGSNDQMIPIAAYTTHRLSLGVAEGPIEIPDGSVPLEYNLDGLHGISFNKGCYIGQELMARTHYQGQIRKRIMPFRTTPNISISPDDDVIDTNTDKKVGTIRSPCFGGFGIALMRLGMTFDGESPLSTLQVRSTGQLIHPFIPSWWPKSYY